MAEAPPDGELNSEPLKYTTWVLRVSIHCEGCKRKVKRILHSVEGVYTIHVERKQHKVIVTGNVDANTLIRKLEKSGKHAELWPNVNNICYQNDEQQQQQQQQNEDDQNQPDEQQQSPDNSCQQQQQQQNVVKEVRFATNVISSGNDVSGNSSSGGGVAAPGPKKKKKKKKSNSSGNSNVNNTVNNNEPGAQPQQEQQHCNNNGPPHPESQQYMGPGPGMGQGPGSGMSPGPGPGMGPGSGMGPGPGMGPQGNMQSNRVYEYAPVYHAPQPMCGVSYNTAYPRTYTSSYYSTPSPYSYLYAYTRGGDVELSMPLDLGGPSALQPQNSFELFSDENPNACSVM